MGNAQQIFSSPPGGEGDKGKKRSKTKPSKQRFRGPNQRPLKSQISVRINHEVFDRAMAEAERRKMRITDAVEESLMEWAGKSSRTPAVFQQANFAIRCLATEQQELITRICVFLCVPDEKMSFYHLLDRDALRKKMDLFEREDAALYNKTLAMMIRSGT